MGWEVHVTSRDPTLDAVGTRSCAIRRGMSKKRARAIFDPSHRVGPRNCKIIYEKYLLSLASRRKITKTKSMLRLLWLLSALLMNYVPSLVACEGCKEPANVIGASGVAGIGASFSWSVLFMIGMLAFLMSGMVFMMIRSCRQLAAQHQRIAVESN